MGALSNSTPPSDTSGQSTAYPFAITELTGDQRSIVLTGRALPYRPFKLATEHRLEVTAYPGSPVLSVQALGAEEKESVLNGMWKDRFLATLGPSGAINYANLIAAVDGISVTTAVDLEKLFHDVVRKGQLLQVSWGSVLRLGFLRRFEREFVYGTDMKWEMTFTWISAGDQNVGVGMGQQVAQQQTKSGMDDQVTRLTSGLNGLQGAIASAQDQVSSLLGQIDTVSSLVQEVGDTIQQAADLASAPDAAAQRAASIYGSLVDACQGVEDSLRSTPTTSILADSIAARSSALVAFAGTPPGQLQPSYASAAQMSIAQAAVAAVARRAMSRAARDLRYSAARARAAVQLQMQAPQLIAQFKARTALDLRAICSLYYGTPSPWRQLGFFIGVKGTSLVPPGWLVSVPRTLPSIPGTQPGLPITSNAAPSIS